MTRGLISLLLLVVSLTHSANAAGAAEINQGNYEALTKGKNSFIKFVRKTTNVFVVSYHSVVVSLKIGRVIGQNMDNVSHTKSLFRNVIIVFPIL